MDVSRPARLMFLGFGEAASLFARGFADAGLVQLSAYDPSVAGGSGEALLRDRAAASGTVLLPDWDAFSDADWVFAMVPPAKARIAAADVAPYLKAGTFYVDFSSASPADKREAADIVGVRGASYVDAGIIGSVPASGHRVPVIASGPSASEFSDVFIPHGMDIALVGNEIGTAAGTKLIRSILAKGLEALYVEALVVAERSGVTKEVLDSFCAFLDARSARETAALLLRSHVVHAARRADEVLMSRDLVLEAGVSPFMTDAIISVMQQTAGTSSAERVGRRQPDNLEDALAVLETELPGSLLGTA